MSRLATSSLTLALLVAAGCGDSASSPDAATAIDAPIIVDADTTPQPVTLAFEARLGHAPFACGASVTNVGTPPVTFTATDARFYVSSVALIDAQDVAQPVTLDANAFQGQGIALLDFENGCGSDGTAAIHTAITGTVPGGTYHAIQFTLGVPTDKDFVDLATAQAPLDVTGMYWIWQFGYKFLKLDGSTPGAGSNPASPFFLHLGSSGCPGSNFELPPTGPCAFPNRVTYTLDNFTPSSSKVILDLDSVLSTSDLTTNTVDTAPGCMSEPADPECATLLPRLGVNDAAPQMIFRVE